MPCGSGGACALARPRRPAAREGEDLPLGGRTTAPSNLSGSRACAVLTAFPLCRRPEPGAERLGDKGAQEGSCFPDWAPAEGGRSRPPPDCALGSALIRKTTQSGAGQTSGPGSPGFSPSTVSAPPLPQGLSPRPKLPDSGFLKSPAQKIPLPRRRARAQARHFRPRPRPVGVVALRLCPAGKGLLRRGSSRAGLGAPRSCAAGGFPAPRWAGCPVAVSGGGAGSAPPARFGPGERVPWALRMPLLRLRVRRSPAPGGALSRPRRLVVRKVTVC